jgi:5-methylcytosine-specific restriction enzyme subunit McrC
MMPKQIRLFEHEKLSLGEQGFGRAHFDRLVQWNEANGFKYFHAGNRSIKFSQYVGVIQVGDLVVEVLPKADRSEDTNKWHKALAEMLCLVHDLPLTSTTDTQLARNNSSILDLFLALFVSEVQGLVRRGLVKRYHHDTGNQLALRGRIHWPGHLRENLVRKERFHVTHQVYDTDHLLHALLKRALEIVEQIAVDPMIQNRAHDLDWVFEEVSHRTLSPQVLDRLRLDRKTKPYTRAVQLATLIIQAHAPDLSGGHMPLIGLLFDMNLLFERVVLKLLKRAAVRMAPELAISGQDSRPFWNGQKIRPDIVIRHKDHVRLIIDTKWKVPKDDRPADADLKQMYVYNRQFGSAESMLLYPGNARSSSGSFEPDAGGAAAHGCALRFVELFDGDGRLQYDSLAGVLEPLLPSAVVTFGKV